MVYSNSLVTSMLSNSHECKFDYPKVTEVELTSYLLIVQVVSSHLFEVEKNKVTVWFESGKFGVGST